MAISLLPPVYQQMPLFRANQVLTYGHLNDMVNYLYQQERYTRSKLLGTGIVCGLTSAWQATSGGRAEVHIHEGIAITSAGYLMVYQPPVASGAAQPYRHRRHFARLGQFAPFDAVGIPNSPPIYELLTPAEFDEERLLPKGELQHADRTGRVLVLLFDPEQVDVAKCLDEGCDDKGAIIRYKIRPLLVPVGILEEATEYTATGRGWKATQTLRQQLRYMKLPPLLRNVNPANLQSQAALANVYIQAAGNAVVTDMENRLTALFNAYPWMFDQANQCLRSEIPALQPSGTSLQLLLRQRVQAFRNAGNLHIQYVYDYLRDVKDAYNELLDALADLISECGGNERLHPFHVMLGHPDGAEAAPCMLEVKYTQPHHRYRNHFIASPLVAGQHGLYDKVRLLHKRLARIIAYFQWNSQTAVVKISPSADYDTPLGQRALPAYYNHTATNALVAVWNEKLTRTHKHALVKGYHLGTQQALLDEDIAPNNFYRIEGVTGRNIATVLGEINAIQQQYNLPFSVLAIPFTVPLPQNTGQHCTWPDLQEDFLYYRDRVLGYLRELMHWLPLWTDRQRKRLESNAQDVMLLSYIREMMEQLQRASCIEHFDYEAWKQLYARLWEWLFGLYISAQQENDSRLYYHFLNSLQNILNLILFAPIYKIWFAFMHRRMVLQHSQLSFAQAGQRLFGLEHLAGVRRGHTFLLAYHPDTGTVHGDFNHPGVQDCGCGCSTTPCREGLEVAVSPLQKPVMMAVLPYQQALPDSMLNYSYLLGKMFAIYDVEQKVYVLQLDEMGFYKGSAPLEQEVLVTNRAGEPFPFVKGKWEGSTLSFIFQMPEQEGSFKPGITELNYTLRGRFEKEAVSGKLYLMLAGFAQRAVDPSHRAERVDINTQQIATANVYPYDIAFVDNRRALLQVEYPLRKERIGNTTVPVFTTAAGNDIGIFKDARGNEYLRVLKVQQPAAEVIPFELNLQGERIRTQVTINLIDEKEKLPQTKMTGVVRNEAGEPLANARVITSGGKEVLTNSKGEYILDGLKAGELLTVERKDFEPIQLQINKALRPEITLKPVEKKETALLDEIELPEGLKAAARELKLPINLKLM
jgi:hypothetical protein